MSITLTDTQNAANKALLVKAVIAHYAGCPDERGDGDHWYNEAGFCSLCDHEAPRFPSIPVLCAECHEPWTPEADEVGYDRCVTCSDAWSQQYGYDHAGPSYA
jgi:hypothetical protein